MFGFREAEEQGWCGNAHYRRMNEDEIDELTNVVADECNRCFQNWVARNVTSQDICRMIAETEFHNESQTAYDLAEKFEKWLDKYGSRSKKQFWYSAMDMTEDLKEYLENDR